LRKNKVGRFFSAPTFEGEESQEGFENQLYGSKRK